uniref:Uncharacterized protein n=1 Tax=Anguilla anguilla TaxID=7936 RepID=A0A0E9PJK0_ANGAN
MLVQRPVASCFKWFLKTFFGKESLTTVQGSHQSLHTHPAHLIKATIRVRV